MRSKSRRLRALICSHDGAGLGRLQFCRRLAEALTAGFPDLSVLVLSASPAAGLLKLGERTDFVRVPGCFPRTEGDGSGKGGDAGEAPALREAILCQVTELFRPDLVIVDQAPLGAEGEMAAALSAARDAGARLVLALRDVLDDPKLLAPEWRRMAAAPALDLMYDQVWIFGQAEIFRPLAGLDLPPSVTRKLRYAGYLCHRDEAAGRAGAAQPFLLVVTGGGQGAEGLIDWVLSAYERDRGLTLPALILAGPFLDDGARETFRRRAAAAGRVRLLGYEPEIGRFFRNAAGVVTTGSYNVLCEILGFDKPALLVPGMGPGREQLIRAVRAEQMGLVRTLIDPLAARGAQRDPATMGEALRALAHQQPPSVSARTGLTDGFDNVAGLAAPLLEAVR